MVSIGDLAPLAHLTVLTPDFCYTLIVIRTLGHILHQILVAKILECMLAGKALECRTQDRKFGVLDSPP